MENSIGEEAIKMACIQTLPGFEFEVAESIKKAFSKIDKREFVILKGFGSFDIILLYTTPSFDFFLTKAGPIKRIIESNSFLCFPYLAEDTKAKAIFEKLLSANFTGFCLIKIDPGVQDFIPEIESRLVAFLHKGGGGQGYVLGTLGWNEIILAINSESINSLFNKLIAVSEIILTDKEQKKTSLLIKTFSFIALNYKILPKLYQIDNAYKNNTVFKTIKQKLDKKSSLRKYISTKLPPVINISSEPMYTEKIVTHWKKDFTPAMSLGKNDISLTQKKRMSWSHFISSLLSFRRQFREKILSTSTNIIGDCTSGHGSTVQKVRSQMQIKSYSFEYLSKIFGTNYASDLASHFYLLNGLLQNPVVGHSFRDMAAYPKYVVRVGKEFKKKNRDPLYFVTDCLKAIKFGAELRSYGSYGNIEEVIGRFSQVRGGTQRSLLGLEFLPSFVMKERIRSDWQGFIITESPIFFHVNEVISVPNDALWNPKTWWALYHEIAHVWINNQPNFINHENPEIHRIIYQEGFPADLLEELCAEIIGYELGFYGNYNLFMKLLWSHLKKAYPVLKQYKSASLETYIIRSFCVKLYEDYFRSEIKPKDDFCNIDLLYEKLLDHIFQIDRITNKYFSKDLNDRHFIAAKNSHYFISLYPIIKKWHETLNLSQISRDKSETKNDNTRYTLEKIMKGKICWEQVEFPEAVLYHIFSRRSLKFNQAIATLLTFWNLQMVHIGKQNYASR